MNQWDQLTGVFGCTLDDESIPECAADNICIAWPSITRCIGQEFGSAAGKRALDFGCGGGLFCAELQKLGFDVTGYDQSEALATIARINVPKEVAIVDSMTAVGQKGRYNLITAIMVLQFIENIENTIRSTLSLLEPEGILIYAVFNPAFIEANLSKSIFTGFVESQMGSIELKRGVKIECYSRTAEEYRSIFAGLGYEEVYVDYPEFTDAFIGKYKMPFSTLHPEYLIQAFRRST